MLPRKSDWQHLDAFIKVFAQLTQNFIGDLDDRKVAELDSILAHQKLNLEGVGFQNALEHFCDRILPQLSASRGPRYWGFVTGGATPVATFADWLVATFDQNLAKDGDSIASEVERQTLQWLAELFKLPPSFDGIITTGATAANFLGALCARQHAGHQQGIDCAKNGLYGLSVEIFTATPHASMLKSLGMAGLGQRQIHRIHTLKNSEAMDVSHLAAQLHQSTALAKIIIGSAGTVTATDFDDLTALAKLAKQHNAWLHIDAAFGIFARLLKDDKRCDGLDLADSITFDSHKWLNVPYESGVFLTRHLAMLEESCHVPAPYLQASGSKPEFMSLGVENSRRFRALPVWMTLLAYGKAGIAQWVKNNIEAAALLASKINQSADYELMHECQLNVVLFRPNCKGLTPEQADAKTAAFLSRINRDGRVFLSPGVWQGRQIIRAALSNWETQAVDIEIAMECLKDVASKRVGE